MSAPAWLFLLWCGCAATSVAAVTGALIGGTARAPWSLAPRPASASHGLAWSLVAGVLVYPLIYGALFEILHRADLRLGLLLGAIHGALALAAAAVRSNRHGALRAGAVHLVYGTAIALLYVTP